MKTRRVLMSIVVVIVVAFSAAPTRAARCDTDVVPAATLLIPYFEVDLDHASGATTLLSVTNQDAAPVLVNVVLWTDWAVPTMSFQVYLAGHDIQSINLRDVLRYGRVPVTGSGVSPHGALSDPPVSFPGCNDGTTPGAAPVYADPAFSASDLEQARAWHTGDCLDGRQAGGRVSGGLAHGYVTVDVVRRCSTMTPADAGYFDADGVADSRNVLTGDYFLVDPGQNYANGETAVHIEAFPGEFSAGDATFYGRYVNNSGLDDREPLGTQYAVRHLAGGSFDGDTRLIVWRDTGSPDASPVEGCGLPSWYFLGGLESFVVFINEAGDALDFQDSCMTLPPCSYPFGVATQAVGLSGGEASAFDLPNAGFGFGETQLVLRRAIGPDPSAWAVLQGWVSVISSAEGRYSISARAFRLDSACDPGPVEPGPEDF